MTNTRWYVYHQNNSGGSFVHDPENGIGYEVIVEASSAKQADALASAIGLYFDGAGDCSCCGNRWSEKDVYWNENDADTVDGYDVLDSVTPGTNSGWYYSNPIGSYAHPLVGKFYQVNNV